MSIESWDTVSGYVFFVRNTRGRTFPMLQTFGLTVSDAKSRVREMIARRAEYNRSPLTIVSLAQVTLTTDVKLAHYATPNAWRAQPTDTFPPLPQRELDALQSASSALR